MNSTFGKPGVARLPRNPWKNNAKKKVGKDEADEDDDYCLDLLAEQEKMLAEQEKTSHQVHLLGQEKIENMDLETRIKFLETLGTNTDLVAAINGDKRYKGFYPTGEHCDIIPATFEGVKRKWKKVVGVPRIGIFENDKQFGTEPFPGYRVWLYRGIYANNTNWDDGERYMYIVRTKPKDPACGDCYIRILDVYHRVCGGPTAKATIQKDQRAGDEDELQFKVWDEHGNVDYVRMRELCDKLNSARYKNNNNNMIEGINFQAWAEILARSQGNIVSNENPFGRFWDYAIPPDCAKYVEDGFIIVFADMVKDILLTRGLGTVDQAKNIMLACVKTAMIPKFNFKPRLTDKNICFESTLALTAEEKVRWHQLESHPGGLYYILLGPGAYEVLSLTPAPFKSIDFDLPTQGMARDVNAKMNIASLPQHEPRQTLTFVTKSSIENAKNKKRKPTQDRCMHSSGHSANKAISTLFKDIGIDQAYAQKHRVAEWLHRSAFSYGGLWTRNLLGYPVPPVNYNTSQTASNLILGTREANSVMMRYESFIKRLAMNNANVDVGIEVNTSFDYSSLRPEDAWVATAKYSWLTPALRYEYRSPVGCTPAIHEIRTIRPFNRENCMVFQAVLDKQVEKEIWGWDVTDFDIGSADYNFHYVVDEFEDDEYDS